MKFLPAELVKLKAKVIADEEEVNEERKFNKYFGHTKVPLVSKGKSVPVKGKNQVHGNSISNEEFNEKGFKEHKKCEGSSSSPTRRSKLLLKIL